ncbi:hypothetical protein CKF42_17725 [Pantoea sp. ARC270]|uniref:DcrB-related protein n=1 Tax=Pantoea sp. ARC270 TaxID=2027923 RepID=UPI000DA9E005|nr:DcrB-related protein [Pantoea sp. ARC270]PZL85310.1 hypothetical protein CKF42_17725 [Pantoea sp. ARC270]
MQRCLKCLEGTIHFDEDVKTQTIDIIAFRSGQQITINRERLPAGKSLAENITMQINNAEKVFQQFNLVKMEDFTADSAFQETVEVIYNFVSNPGSGKRVWQVTYVCLNSESDIINFTSLYPDEISMKNEISRLRHCVKNFAHEQIRI